MVVPCSPRTRALLATNVTRTTFTANPGNHPAMTTASRVRTIGARAPARIDFGGGWTDVPPYCDREGGFVCNMAIDRYATVRISPRDPTAPRPSDETPLVRAAIDRARVDDAHVAVENDFPVGAGLGGSSAASAALLLSLSAWRGAPSPGRVALAERGRRIEVEDLGVAGGRQDHYAATHGGALALTFTTAVAVKHLAVTPALVAELVARSTLLYTGESRISGDTITAVLGAYEAGVTRVLVALQRMRELARSMASALERGDLDDLGALLGEHWMHQRSLHPSIPTPRIDAIVERAGRAGALGAKAMGASGGGCVLIIAGQDNADAVRAAVAPLGEVLSFGMDADGVTLLGESR